VGDGSDDGSAVESVTLRAGDLLYHPAGLWHEVVSDADSLSVNVSLVSASWMDLGAAAVRQLMLADAGWRRAVALGPQPALSSVMAVGDDVDGSGDPPLAAAAAAPPYTAALRAPASTSTLSSRLYPAPLLAGVDAMLRRLAARLATLRPEDLLPPAALLSYRHNDAVRELPDDDGGDGSEADSEGGGESGSTGGQQHDDGESTIASTRSSSAAPPPPCSAAVSSFCASHGLLIYRRRGELHLAPVDGDGTPSADATAAGSEGADGRRWRVNPLASLIASTDVEPPSAVGNSGGGGGRPRHYLANVNFGGGGGSEESDFASQCRAVLHVTPANGDGEHLEQLHGGLHAVMAAIAARTSVGAHLQPGVDSASPANGVNGDGIFSSPAVLPFSWFLRVAAAPSAAAAPGADGTAGTASARAAGRGAAAPPPAPKRPRAGGVADGRVPEGKSATVLLLRRRLLQLLAALVVAGVLTEV
jgi:hypothetical protein